MSFYRKIWKTCTIANDIPIIFHNGSIYDNHSIIKELLNEFEGEFKRLGENTENCITFSVKINKKITKKDKDGGQNIVNIPYRLKFIDSYRFMSFSLSSLVDNFSDGLHNNKRADCKSSLDYLKVDGAQLIFRCLNCNKDYNKDFNKELINTFSNTYNFRKENINKFILC